MTEHTTSAPRRSVRWGRRTKFTAVALLAAAGGIAGASATASAAPIGWNAKPAIGWNAKPAIGWNAKPAIGWNAKPAIGWNAKPAIGWNAKPAIGWN